MEIVKDAHNKKRPFSVMLEGFTDTGTRWIPAKYLKGAKGGIRRFATREAAEKALHAALAGEQAKPAKKAVRPAKKAESAVKPAKTAKVKLKTFSGADHPTSAMYEPLQHAFDLFNREFFDNELPRCLITLNEAQPRVIAHYRAEAFVSTESGEKFVDEIAFNPDHLARGELLTLSTLLHEAAHAWRHLQPKPATKGYHDKQWAQKMKECGLQPRAIVKEGAKPKEVGHKVSHDIMPGGHFERVALTLIDQGWRLHWVGRNYPAVVAGGNSGTGPGDEPGAGGETPAKKQTRAKFVCPSCGQAAWAKHGARLICGECEGGLHMQIEGASGED